MILFILISLLLLKFVSAQFRIVRTKCLLETHDCPEVLKAIVDESLGSFFFQVDKEKLVSSLENTGMVLSPIINISRNELEVVLSKTTENTTIKIIYSSQTPPHDPINLNDFLATQSAKVMSINIKGILENSDQDSNYYFVGNQLPDRDILLRLRRWISVLKNISEKERPTLFTDQEVIYSPVDKLLAVFNINKSPDEELALMGKLIEQAKSKGSTVLDFRYNHPILR